MPRATRFALYALAALAALAFLRFYVYSTRMWLNIPSYLAGTERLPFQFRVLPIPFLIEFNRLGALFPILSQGQAVLRPDKFSFFCLSTIAFAIASTYLFRLYSLVSRTRQFSALVFPIFLVLCLWTYTVHIGDVLSYPYDLPALAFFTAGLCYIYERRFLATFLVVLIGTFNRETTLFLIAIFLIDAASVPTAPSTSRLRDRIDIREISTTACMRALALALTWLTIEVSLHHHFAHNNRSEDFLRAASNLPKFLPRQWPALLNIGAYTLPAILLLRRHLQPTRFANYLLIFPLWFVIMFFAGVLTETRIYGELTAYLAVSVVLLIEDHARTTVPIAAS